MSMQAEDPLPMPYHRSGEVYKEMKRTAKKLKDEHNNDMLVWEGFMTHLIDSCGLPTPAYTSVLGHLKRMGCIVQLRRGGSTTKSMWQLCHEPTEELFQNSVQRGPKVTKTAQLEQQVHNLDARLGKIEKALFAGGVSL